MNTNAALLVRDFQLEPTDNTRLANLCGPLDENLHLLEARLAVQIRRRGTAFHIQGARAEAAEQLLRELYARAEQWPITGEQVHLSLVALEADGEAGAAGERDSAARPRRAQRAPRAA